MSSTDQHLRMPTRDELRDFAQELRRESKVRVPLELDPRSPLYRRSELRSAVIAVGAVTLTLFVGLTVGLVALFG